MTMPRPCSKSWNHFVWWGRIAAWSMSGFVTTTWPAVRIEDRIEGTGRHRFELSFHLAPGWSAVAGEEGWGAESEDGRAEIRFSWIRPPAGCRLRVEEDLHSPSYGVTRKAWTVRVEWEGEAPCTIRYALMPLERGRG